MPLKPETSDPIEQHDDGNVSRPHSRGAILSKRVIGALVLVLSVLMLTMYAYARSTYLGSTDWLIFCGYELIIVIGVIVGVVPGLKKIKL